mgnify:CR=1 FL=1
MKAADVAIEPAGRDQHLFHGNIIGEKVKVQTLISAKIVNPIYSKNKNQKRLANLQAFFDYRLILLSHVVVVVPDSHGDRIGCLIQSFLSGCLTGKEFFNGCFDRLSCFGEHSD